MDINARYMQLATELGCLDFEILAKDKRREAIRAEMIVLQRLAATMQPGGANAAASPSIDAAPYAASTAAPASST